MTRYFCCDERRREGLKNHATLNGIDFLEVDDDASLPDSVRLLRQRVLKVYFVKPILSAALTLANVQVTGGERITNVSVERVATDAANDHLVIVTVDRVGDFSPYQLKLVVGPDNEQPPANIDPRSASVEFSFKVACPSDFDCIDEKVCPPKTEQEPVIDYLAKDYASFRRLILDRLSYLMPDWQARTPADMTTAVAELPPYIGDYLSWRQDAVGTEAYSGTARLRTSVRRHARLVDYHMHDGRNARVWIHLHVTADTMLPAHTQCLTQVPGLPIRFARESAEYAKALNSKPQVFETLDDANLFVDHNELEFYTWGDLECCLPAGATKVTLRGHFPDLAVGHVLVFEEVLGPVTGDAADANPQQRHAVQLTEVELVEDPLGGQFGEMRTDDAVPVTRISWDIQDALAKPLCISTQTEDGYEPKVSIARGNIVLADHGMQVEESLGPVPASSIKYPPPPDRERCDPIEAEWIPPRFRPRLHFGPITQAARSYEPKSASTALEPPLAFIRPAISLIDSEGFTWQPLRDLINNHRFSRKFVAEVEQDGATYLRFGGDGFGRFPEPNEEFSVSARVGNGSIGNLGADGLRHVVTGDSAIESISNRMPAVGGLDPESIREVAQNAPYAFRTQERAVTEEDWAEVTKRHHDVQNAVGTFRWTGSWYTVFVTVDRFSGRPVDGDFELELRGFLEKYRLAGYDLEVDAPRYVSLELKLHICVAPNYFRDAVKQEALQVLSTRSLVDSSRGVFHPDNFTFGQTVYLSPTIARVQQIEGVSSVEAKVFRRQGSRSRGGLDSGMLELGRLEIARLENSANFPEQGVLELEMEGGA